MPITEADARSTGPVLRRDIRQSDVVCPAGTACGGNGVLCAIEQRFIEAEHEGTSLALWCANPGLNADTGYQNCPTWRDAKDRDREKRLSALEEG